MTTAAGSDSVHRLFFVRTARLPAVRAVAHWTGAHAPLFAQTPGLLGYTQNRPLIDSGLVSSETVFADRASERAAYASAYYTDVVTADEERFLDRDSVVSPIVIDTLRVRGERSRFRVLCPVGGTDDPVDAVGVDHLTLDREAAADTGTLLRSAWFADVEAALGFARGARSWRFASECVPILSRSEDGDS